MGAVFFLVMAISGCASSPDSFGGSREAAIRWASERGFEPLAANSSPFSLLALHRGKAAEWKVYIEGDGAPWLTPFHPPADPTPLQPLSLALAARDPAPAVLYLGRPCQYLTQEALADCSPAYWTRRRFSAELINAYHQQLDAFKSQFAIRKFRLVGFSGGGLIAALLAAQRDDVDLLITVASPLSLRNWLGFHALSPMPDAQDPADPQWQYPKTAWHFGGSNDAIVPFRIIQDFVASHGGTALQVPEFDHHCCWSRDWPKLLELVQ